MAQGQTRTNGNSRKSGVNLSRGCPECQKSSVPPQAVPFDPLSTLYVFHLRFPMSSNPRIGSEQATRYLALLVGKPLSGAHNTLSAESFLFGRYEPGETLEFAAPIVLQADCPWDLGCPDSTVASSRVPAVAVSNRHTLIGQFLAKWAKESDGHGLYVTSVKADNRGKATIRFENKCELHINDQVRHRGTWILMSHRSTLMWAVGGGFRYYEETRGETRRNPRNRETRRNPGRNPGTEETFPP
ncbi:MAG: hypothetical protein RL328_372 [Acidobacteriota bacterium]